MSLPVESEQIARRVVELLRESGFVATPAQTEVLTRAEAMSYTKRRSHAAFSVWCRANNVRAASRGRYSRTLLDLALQRESRRRAA